MKWKLTKNLPELEGKIFPSQTEGFYFQVVSASKKLGLEMIALDEVNERYTLFDIPTTSSSIAQALREEAEELVFQWMHPEQSDIEEAAKSGRSGLSKISFHSMTIRLRRRRRWALRLKNTVNGMR